MKKVLIFSALFLLASVSLSAQVVKGAGLWYFNGVPNVTPSVATGTEVAYSINSKALYKWNRTTSAWVVVVQDSSVTNELQDLILSNDTLSLTLSDSIVLMAQYRNHVWEIASLSDTTSVTDPIEGDIAYTSTGDTIAFRGAAAWLPFTGGGGGGTFNSFNIAGDTGSDIVTDGQTVTIAGGYGINTAESGGTVTVTADTTQLVTPFDIAGLMANWLLGGTSGTPQTVSSGQTATIAAGTGMTTTAAATRTVTVAITNTGVSAATYGSASQVPVFAVNAQGQLTTATNTAIQIAISQVTGLADSLTSHPSGTGTNLRIPVWTGTNSLGSSTLLQSAAGQTLDANLAFRITGGTPASRPTGAAGMWYWNTSNAWWDTHNGTSWLNPTYGTGTSGLLPVYSTNGIGIENSRYNNNIATDWNVSDNSKFYFVFGTTNSPIAGITTGISIPTGSGGFERVMQLAADQSTGPYYRMKYNGVWLSWYRIMTQNNGGAGSLFNADFLDGLSSGDFAPAVSSVSSNWNVVDPLKFTLISTASNAPVSGQIYVGAHFPYAASQFIRGLQIASAFGSDRMFYRNLNSAGTYTAWKNIASGYPVAGNIPFWGANLFSAGDTLRNNSLLFFDNTNIRIGVGTSSPDRTMHSELSDAVTNAMTFPLRLTHITSGTAAAGSGAGMEFEAESAGGTNRVAGTIENPYTAATNAAEVSDLVFRTMRAGTLTESLRSLGNGTLQIGTLSGTATQLVGATSGNIITAVTLGAGLSFSSGTLNGAFLPLTLTGATEVNTAGQSLYIRDAGGYPFQFMNSNYWLAASGVNNYIDIGSTASNVKIISDGLIELNSSVNTSIITTGRFLIDGDSTVVSGTLPVNTNATHVLVRDAVTERLEEKAVSTIGSGVYLPLSLAATTEVVTNGNQLTMRDSDSNPRMDLSSAAWQVQGNTSTTLTIQDADIDISAGATGGDVYVYGVAGIAIESDANVAINSDYTAIGGQTSGGGAGVLRINEDTDNGANYISIAAPDALSGNTGYIWPSSVGTAGQQLTTNGSNPATLTWTSAGADGNGIISALPSGNVTIDTDGNILQFENSASGTGYTTVEAAFIYIEANGGGPSTGVGGGAVSFSGGDGTIDASANLGIDAADTLTVSADAVIINSNIQVYNLVGLTAAPSLAINNAGTGATVTGYSAESSAVSGRFTFTTGTGAMAGGNVISVTFPVTLPQVGIVQIGADGTKNTAGGLAAAVLIGAGKAIPIAGTNSFTLYVDATGLANSTRYDFTYTVSSAN